MRGSWYGYGDYRRMRQSAFLLGVLKEKEDKVRDEMGRWGNVMERLRGLVEKGNEEEFALDCYQLTPPHSRYIRTLERLSLSNSVTIQKPQGSVSMTYIPSPPSTREPI